MDSTLDELEAELDRLESEKLIEMQYTGRSKPTTREKLSKTRKKFNATISEQEDLILVGEAKVSTYPSGDILDLFNKFRNEYYAYSFGSNTRVRGEDIKVLQSYFGESLKKAMEHPRFEVIWGQITNLFNNALRGAYKSGLQPNQIAPSILASRSFEQAIKFLQIETSLRESPVREVPVTETPVRTLENMAA